MLALALLLACFLLILYRARQTIRDIRRLKTVRWFHVPYNDLLHRPLRSPHRPLLGRCSRWRRLRRWLLRLTPMPKTKTHLGPRIQCLEHLDKVSFRLKTLIGDEAKDAKTLALILGKVREATVLLEGGI